MRVDKGCVKIIFVAKLTDVFESVQGSKKGTDIVFFNTRKQEKFNYK